MKLVADETFTAALLVSPIRSSPSFYLLRSCVFTHRDLRAIVVGLAGIRRFNIKIAALTIHLEASVSSIKAG